MTAVKAYESEFYKDIIGTGNREGMREGGW